MYRYLIFLFAALLLGSCENTQSKEKKEFDDLFAEVMAIHDDVMPETSNLYKLKKYAQENIDVIPDTSAYIEQLRNAQLRSVKADDAMMEWMANFKIPESDHQSKIAYLKSEKIAISKVRELMLTTLYDEKKVIAETDEYIKSNKLRDDTKTTFTPNN